MKAKEIQIGDWLKMTNANGEWLDNVQIDENLMLLYIRDGEDGVIRYEPIPLTPEILEKNGFILQSEANRVHHKMYSMPTDYRHSLEDTEKKGGFYWQSNGALICWLRYLHELQHALRLCGLDEMADNLTIE